jgi:hypothetical protein
MLVAVWLGRRSRDQDGRSRSPVTQVQGSPLGSPLNTQQTNTCCANTEISPPHPLPSPEDGAAALLCAPLTGSVELRPSVRSGSGGRRIARRNCIQRRPKIARRVHSRARCVSIEGQSDEKCCQSTGRGSLRPGGGACEYFGENICV